MALRSTVWEGDQYSVAIPASELGSISLSSSSPVCEDTLVSPVPEERQAVWPMVWALKICRTYAY